MENKRYGNAALTEEEVREIRRMQGLMCAREAGKPYGIASETVRRIWRRESWAYLKDNENA